MQVTLNPVIIDRFRAALSRLQLLDDDRMLCAVSGGPDSMALLIIAQQALSGRIIAATVDHQLRPESSTEAVYVQEICHDLGVPHLILTPESVISGNIQSSARVARYALLGQAAQEHGCAFITTAHHADDQLETLMMRLARGSGIDGLSAIRARNGNVIRPLLEFTKAELIDVCVCAGIKPVDDPSNSNADFDRVAIRHWLAATDHPFRADRAGRTATALGEAAEALVWATNMLASERIRHENNNVICDARDLPNELKRRLLLRALVMLDNDLAPRGDAIDRLLADLAAGRATTIGNIKCLGGECWQFSPAPPRGH